MDIHKKIITLILGLVLVLSSLAIYLTGLVPSKAQAVYFGGANTFYVPPMGNCPQHIWVFDFTTNSPVALTNFGGRIYDYGNVFQTGRFVLGEYNAVPNPPCLIQISPPVPLPYPLHNIIQEGTS